MKQGLLLKYISGKASQQEKEEVTTWIDADAAHLKEFMSLRKTYDAFLWQDMDEFSARPGKTIAWKPVIRGLLQIAAIFILAFGLSYVLLRTFHQPDIKMQTVYVPAGQRTHVTLADGTTVWVNGKSTLTFPNQFSSNSRTVKLDGEAYFDVHKDPEKQFIVSTAHQSAIKVLGTKFNVKAYREEEEVITTLVEGKVNFEFNYTNQQPQYIVMAPGQKLIYYSQNGKTELYTTSGERELAWKDGKIIFRQASLREALEILSDRYNVEFVIRKSVPHDDSFSGTFTNRSLEQILNFIKASSQIRWRYMDSAQSNKEKIKIEIFI